MRLGRLSRRERPRLGRAVAMGLCLRFCWVAYVSCAGDYRGVCDSPFSHQLAVLPRTRTADRDRRPDPHRRPSRVRVSASGARHIIGRGPRLSERVWEERSPQALASEWNATPFISTTIPAQGCLRLDPANPQVGPGQRREFGSPDWRQPAARRES